jgi:hypothetical protein
VGRTVIRRDCLTYDRNLIFGCGQSNAGDYGGDLTAWPVRERLEANVAFSNDGYAVGWESLADCIKYNGGLGFTRGTIWHSLGARMRDAGLRPAICAQWIGGARSETLLAGMGTIAPLFADRYAEQGLPRSVTLVWSQGEAEAAVDGPADWRSNTEASIAAIRVALALPTLPVIVLQLATSYTPGMDLPYLTETRAEQAALVAADQYATLVDVGAVATATSGIHLDQPSLDRQARLIVASAYP